MLQNTAELKKELKKEREEREMLQQETTWILKRANKIHDQLEQYESDSMMRNSCRWFRKEPPLSSSKKEVESWNEEDAQARYVVTQDDAEQFEENLPGLDYHRAMPRRACRKTSREAPQHCPLHRQRTESQPGGNPSVIGDKNSSSRHSCHSGHTASRCRE